MEFKLSSRIPKIIQAYQNFPLLLILIPVPAIEDRRFPERSKPPLFETLSASQEAEQDKSSITFYEFSPFLQHCQELNELRHEACLDRLNCIPYFVKQWMLNATLSEDTMTPAHCFKSRSLILATVLVCGLGFFTHANAQTFPTHAFLVDLNSRSATVIDLGTLDGTSYSWARGINDAGQVVGYTSTTADEVGHAFITGPNGMGMRDLGTLSEIPYSWALGINDAGQVAGYSPPKGHPHAFITGPDGMGMRDLGTLGGTYSYAYGINEAGQVVGQASTAGANSHAFITGPDGVGMRDLGTLGGTYSYAFGINDAGQVAGYSSTAEGNSHAFITGPDGMGMRDLGTLGGTYSYAYGINEAGQVVGQASTADGNFHAFITGPDGVGMRDLGTLGASRSSANGINDAGQVVGDFATAEGNPYAFITSHAFITGPDGKGMVDLNSLVDLPGIILTSAAGINNNGQVIVMGVIPEPETYALMLAGLGLIGLMGGARRRRTRTRELGERLE